jgi:nicotinate dehydrogenase subunit A
VTPQTAVWVNGTSRSVTSDPRTPLLYVLRGELGLLGTKFGCGTGSCGACTVLLDQRPVTSCDLPLSSVGSADVLTVEGLARRGGASRLQACFETEQAGQCGYCLSGILMTATALLVADPHPDEPTVRRALDRNLCRCGSHNRIVRAVLRAAAEPR